VTGLAIRHIVTGKFGIVTARFGDRDRHPSLKFPSFLDPEQPALSYEAGCFLCRFNV